MSLKKSRICIDIPPGLKKEMEEVIEKGYFTTLADMIRYAVRQIIEELKKKEEAQNKANKGDMYPTTE